MNIPAINKTLKTSLSDQIKHSILDAIESGILKHNSPLPYEEDIADFYHVSRSIVRKAYDELENMGFITRIKRLGTRVRVLPSYYIHLDNVLRFPNLTLSTSNQAMDLDPQLILKELLKPKHVLNELSTLVTPWLRETTMFNHQNKPFILCDAYYPSDLSEENLNTLSIYQIRELFKNKLQIDNLRISFDYRIIKASSFISLGLNLSNEAVIFHFNIKLINSDDNCLTLIQLYADATSIHLLDKGV